MTSLFIALIAIVALTSCYDMSNTNLSMAGKATTLPYIIEVRQNVVGQDNSSYMAASSWAIDLPLRKITMRCPCELLDKEVFTGYSLSNAVHDTSVVSEIASTPESSALIQRLLPHSHYTVNIYRTDPDQRTGQWVVELNLNTQTENHELWAKDERARNRIRLGR